jgi:putative exosortase-associated protein (TIGR04073 family)
MKKNKLGVSAFLVLLMLGTSVSFAQASDAQGEQYKWNQKMGRGFLNLATGLLEVPREINFTSNDINLAGGWTYGLARGLGFGLVRMGTGFMDVLSAPFNWPDANKASLVEPDYPWQQPRTKLK